MLPPDPITAEMVRPLRRREYDRLIELGAFADERIELLDGHGTGTAEPLGSPSVLGGLGTQDQGGAPAHPDCSKRRV